MTDRQHLLIALLSESDATSIDLAHMRLLELMAIVDLVEPKPACAR